MKHPLNRVESVQEKHSAVLGDPPNLQLELVQDDSSAPSGFLWIVRRRYQVRFPSGRVSGEFTYDTADRRARDAVVLVAHCETRAGRAVYLRSALRPPLILRDPLHSPVPEVHAGNLWELPAGLVEAEEARDMDGVKRAAVRELREELGFDVPCDSLTDLGSSVFPAPGMVAERQFFFSVQVDPKKQLTPELDGSVLEEEASIVLIELSEALDLCRAGKLPDAKTELALRRFAELWAK
jgi:ADP-ribose pyrophosphatase